MFDPINYVKNARKQAIAKAEQHLSLARKHKTATLVVATVLVVAIIVLPPYPI